MNYTKHPVTLAAFLGSILLIVGGFMPLLNIPAEVQRSFDTATFDQLMTFVGYGVVIVGVLGLLLTYLSSSKASKALGVINMLIGLAGIGGAGFLMGSLSSAIMKAQNITFSTGFYLVAVGGALLFLGALAGLFVYKKSTNIPEMRNES